MSLNFVSGGVSKPKGFGSYGEAEKGKTRNEVDDNTRFSTSQKNIDQQVLDELLTKGRDSTRVKDETDVGYIPAGLLPAEAVPQATGAAEGDTLYEQLKRNKIEQDMENDGDPGFVGPKQVSEDEAEFLDGQREDEKRVEKERVSADRKAMMKWKRERDRMTTQDVAREVSVFAQGFSTLTRHAASASKSSDGDTADDSETGYLAESEGTSGAPHHGHAHHPKRRKASHVRVLALGSGGISSSVVRPTKYDEASSASSRGLLSSPGDRTSVDSAPSLGSAGGAVARLVIESKPKPKRRKGEKKRKRDKKEKKKDKEKDDEEGPPVGQPAALGALVGYGTDDEDDS